jgi:urate oxidase
MTPHEATQNALTVREAAVVYAVREVDLRAALSGDELPYHVDHDRTVYVAADDVSEWAAHR